ncbi:phage holin family protein [Cellulomonas wangsupingiae]|uniref:Phage holin family protein n=1 Tax=Cellulomonas wangsupingiae TaxID=2968085 RepID=A0ABY5K1Y3_9CELL|nr:phage holin family protein [Cellulomonas wangsupingiae]MCC2335386.1 phage holin family protein [Cellulomonas wangsupingiae]UUI64437.1 phage holin family protein [Cellulomonas wangsupingiae]
MVTHSGWGSDTRPDAPEDPRSLGQLVSDVTEQASRLVRAEIALAKAEVTAKAKEAGIGAGLLAGAAVLALYLLATLITTAILGLATVVAPWLAALIVSLVLLVVVAVLAFVGLKHVKKGVPPVPERAMENVQEDVDTVKKGLHR